MNIDKEEFHISKTKAVFSALPVIGGVLNEFVFDYHARIQQNRLNSFFELLKDYFSKHTSVDVEKIKSEDFADIFAEIINRVKSTKSITKQKLFRNIIANFLQRQETNTEHYINYLNLIDSITEKEIEILTGYSKIDPEYLLKRDKLRQQLYELNMSIDEKEHVPELSISLDYLKVERINLEINLKILNDKWESNKKYATPGFYNIDEGQLLYYKQSLHSKALLEDIGIGRIEIHAFQIMGITKFGKQFIDFILNEDI